MIKANGTKPIRLTDGEIRKAIHADIVPILVGDSDSRVLDEMSVCSGEARIDIAVINGHLHGFEIKSEADTLERLPGQANAYSRIFDTVTIICGENHAKSIIKHVPKWWAVYTAKLSNGKVTLTQIRKYKLNNSVDKHSLVQLLWKSELISLLNHEGIKNGVSNKPCRELWEMVCGAFTTSLLQIKVREILKARECWRLAAQPM